MADIQFIKPPNALRKVKVGQGEARLDPFLIRRAETAVAALRDDDGNWGTDEFDQMDEALARLEKSGNDLAGLRALHRNLMDLRAQAASYGYALLGDIAGKAMEFSHLRKSLDENDLAILRIFLSAMRAIHKERRAGDGGPLGRDLFDCLAALADRGPE